MATMYELTEQWLAVLALAEDGADPEAVGNALADIGGEIEDKADGYAKVIKQLEGEAEMIKAEKERLYKKETTLKNNARDIKKRLEEAMMLCGKPKFKTGLFSFNIQKNAPSLVIDDEQRLKEYLNLHKPDLLVRTLEIKKDELKKAIKAGLEVEYASLRQSESLRIG